MAKRVPPDEKPYRPLDDALVRSVLAPDTGAAALQQRSASPASRPVLVTGAKAGQLLGRKALCLAERAGQAGQATEEAPSLERLSREKRVLLTATEDRELERLVADMAAGLGTPLKASHLLRATFSLLDHAGEELVKQSRKVGPVKRPPNNDPAGLAAFEHYLARVVEVAIRNTRPLS